jgi:hypothetical protein
MNFFLFFLSGMHFFVNHSNKVSFPFAPFERWSSEFSLNKLDDMVVCFYGLLFSHVGPYAWARSSVYAFDHMLSGNGQVFFFLIFKKKVFSFFILKLRSHSGYKQ